MYLSAIIINTIAISFPFISMVVYARLLLAIYYFKSIKKAPELSLFYFKFAMDFVISTISVAKLILYALTMTSLMDFFASNHYLTYLIVYPINLMTAMRGILLFIIAMDRTIATYFPIKFFKYRKFISTLSIIGIVLSYPVIDVIVAFLYCRPDLESPTTCVSAMCVLGECYQNYSLTFQQVCYSMITVATMMLCIKLFIWNRYKKQSENQELKRANRLAIIDAGIIVIFDLIPPIAHTLFPSYFVYVGALNSVAQTLGFVVESYLCTVNVQRKCETRSGNSIAFVRSGTVETIPKQKDKDANKIIKTVSEHQPSF